MLPNLQGDCLREGSPECGSCGWELGQQTQKEKLASLGPRSQGCLTVCGLACAHAHTSTHKLPSRQTSLAESSHLDWYASSLPGAALAAALRPLGGLVWPSSSGWFSHLPYHPNGMRLWGWQHSRSLRSVRSFHLRQGWRGAKGEPRHGSNAGRMEPAHW